MTPLWYLEKVKSTIKSFFKNKLILTFIVFTALGLGHANAAALQPGDLVIVAKQSADLRVKDKPVGKLQLGELLRVSLIKKDWLLVWEKQGWVNRGDVWTTTEAEECCNDQIRKKPTTMAYHLRGVARRAAGKYQEAVADFSIAIKLNPKNAAAYNNRGSAWHKLGELDRALDDFSKAIELAEKTTMYWVNRSAAWAAKGETNKALLDAQQAVQIDSKSATALNSRGVCWFDLGELKKALADYERAIKLAPHFATAYSNRAAVFKRQNQFEEARKDYAMALRINPQIATANNDYAWFLATCSDKRFRDPKKAVQLARRACRLTDDKDWNMLDTLAVVYAENADFKQATSTLEAALKLAPQQHREALRKKLEAYLASAEKTSRPD